MRKADGSLQKKMLAYVTFFLLLAGISGQSDDDTNDFVDKVLKDEFPAETKWIDPLILRPFSLEFGDHPRGWVKFHPTNVTGLKGLERSGDCERYLRRFPRKVVIGCNVTFGVLSVESHSTLKYGNFSKVSVTTTFPEAIGRLYFSVGAWKLPSAQVYPKLGDFNATFSGLDESPETQHLRLGYYEVLRDLLAVAVERQLSYAVGSAARRVLFPF